MKLETKKLQGLTGHNWNAIIRLLNIANTEQLEIVIRHCDARIQSPDLKILRKEVKL